MFDQINLNENALVVVFTVVIAYWFIVTTLDVVKGDKKNKKLPALLFAIWTLFMMFT
ncbi:hypothetical protein [Pontibacillus yanchengensis]|uniref:hypothetical protein n=1 Tax=Pontibacillus yanchengensis TaxID=462910 RepID=UPI000A522B0B|nr:hypothetical protein [Pontibacillus yanchengensis]